MEPKEETIHAALTAEAIRLLSAYHAATEEQKKIVGYILKINEITMNIEELKRPGTIKHRAKRRKPS